MYSGQWTCTPGDGHVYQTTDERWGQNRNTAMYSVARQTRTGTELRQPCTRVDRREVGPGWKHSHVPQATDEAGVRVKTQPCTSVLDRQEQGQDGNSHVLQTTDERWGHGGNTAMLQATGKKWGQDGNTAI